ncbi:MAG: nuclear transport factor 2 family protein [Chloroflexi bacterium]|nr:nuclear transport factor 2 family protein [Chloroflexota bacterium]
MNYEQDIEAIKRLKYKYYRCVDTKLWDELRECFIPDATTSYRNGQHSFSGVDNIMAFLSRRLGPLLTMHHGHHPEIEITSPTTAKGTWSLEDYVIDRKAKLRVHGGAFYSDDYVKIDGQWKIKHTGYVRTFEEMWDEKDIPGLRITAQMFPVPWVTP